MQKSRPLWEGGGSGTACHLRTCLRLLGLGPVSATGPGMRPLGWAQGRRPASQAESTSTAEVEGGETERQGHMVSPLPLPPLAPGATLALPQPRDACPTAPPPGQGARQLTREPTPGPETRGPGFFSGAEGSPH